jgi:hypothetical protein
MVTLMGTATMAKKKPELKLTAVKIDVTLARKAKTIADDRGIPLSTYLSGAVETAVAKDWPKILKKMVEEAGE